MTRLILELKRRGKTILLCSHFLAEVEEVCDRVGIMYTGRLVTEGALSELAGESTQIVITTAGLTEEGAGRVAKQPGVVNVENNLIRMGEADMTQLWPVLESIQQTGAEILEVTRPRPALQDIFVRTIGEVRE